MTRKPDEAAILQDAQRRWDDVRSRGWDKDTYDPWTYERCLWLARDYAQAVAEGRENCTSQVFAPGEPLRIAEWAVHFNRVMIDLQTEEGLLTPERRDLCLRALAARVLNIHSVIFDGAEPWWDRRA